MNKNFTSVCLKLSWMKLFLIFASLSFLLRVTFFIWESDTITFSAAILFKAFFLGLFFDFITLGYITFVPLVHYALIPSKIFNSKIHQNINKGFYFLFLFVIIFSCFSEIVFWEEFQVRFNFIAVDYLVYTTEVVENIIESYPMKKLLSAIFIITSVLFYFTQKKIITQKTSNYFSNLKKALIVPTLVIVAFFTVNSEKLTEVSDNNYVNEIAANGIYQLFSAYRNNQLDYDAFYLKKDNIEDSINALRSAISENEPNSKFLNNNDISRLIPQARKGEEKKHNIIFVTIESFDAAFMKFFGNRNDLTPNLDQLAKEGLFFTNLKATGTRTVRGLEAISLSIPPTPGNSIVRRPNNENLFNISSPLRKRGYEAKFIYGGAGYFDNMNYFFSNNGFEIVDRTDFEDEEVSFSNAWGVADEDLFDKTIKEADLSYSQNKPFFNFVMTTSNHRPFTYPEGKIDIPSKTGREGAVKYTDYAIGKLIEKSKEKPWFDNTIFVFIADHCAGSAGNTDLPIWRYQIPAIFYAPKIIQPRIFDKNISQIDIAPTLMGVLNLSYKSKFFGTDVISNEKTIDEHSFISTYSDVGYLKGDDLYSLQPKKGKRFYKVQINEFGWQGSNETEVEEYDVEELNRVIGYYQSASYFFNNDKLKDFTENQ